MRREEFLDSMNYMDDLFDFARDNDLQCYYDVVCGSDLDDSICDDLRNGDVTHHLTWEQIRDALSDIDSGCDYYTRGDGWLEYNELCYEDFAEAIMDEMDANDLWDEDEPEEEEDDDFLDEDDEEEDDDLAEEDECLFSFDELAADARDEVASIRERLILEEKERREEEQRLMEEAQKMIDDAAAAAKREEADRIAMVKGLLAF